MRRCYHESEYAHAAKIMGVDVAREGDDASVIFSRQGNLCWQPQVLRNVDGFQGAARSMRGGPNGVPMPVSSTIRAASGLRGSTHCGTCWVATRRR